MTNRYSVVIFTQNIGVLISPSTWLDAARLISQEIWARPHRENSPCSHRKGIYRSTGNT